MIGIERSICKQGWFHRFMILRQLQDGVEEGCLICRTKRIYKVVDGRIDNLAYLKEHIRQAIPFWHPKFKREYGRQY